MYEKWQVLNLSTNTGYKTFCHFIFMFRKVIGCKNMYTITLDDFGSGKQNIDMYTKSQSLILNNNR